MLDSSIERRLKREILAAIDAKIAIRMSRYGVSPNAEGLYELDSANVPGNNCRVCAIGAALIGRPGNPNQDRPNQPAIDFARLVDRSEAWGAGLNDGTIGYFGNSERWSEPDFEQGFQLGQRILAWVRANSLDEGYA